LFAWIMQSFGADYVAMLKFFGELPYPQQATAKFLSTYNYNVVSPFRYYLFYESMEQK